MKSSFKSLFLWELFVSLPFLGFIFSSVNILLPEANFIISSSFCLALYFFFCLIMAKIAFLNESVKDLQNQIDELKEKQNKQ